MHFLNLLGLLVLSTSASQTVIFHYKSDQKDSQVESARFQNQLPDSIFSLNDSSKAQAQQNPDSFSASKLIVKARDHILQLTSTAHRDFDVKLFEEQLKENLKENIARLEAKSSLPACPIKKKRSTKLSGEPIFFIGTGSQRAKLLLKEKFIFIEVLESGKLKNPFMQHFISMFKVKCYPSLVLAEGKNSYEVLEGLEALAAGN